MATVGNLKVDLGLNSAAFDTGLKKAMGSLDGLAKSAAVMGAAVATAVAAAGAALTAVVVKTSTAAKATGEMADMLGLNVEALQELRHAADRTGMGMQNFDVAMRRFIRRSSEAAKGTGAAKDAFKELGIQLKDGQGNLKGSEALLAEVADALEKVESPADKLRLAFKMFDTDGAKMVNVLAGGSEELARMREEARKLGIVLEEDTIRAAQRFHDNLDTLRKGGEAVANQITAMALPAFVAITNAMVNVSAQMGDVVAGFMEFARYAGVAVAALAGFFAPTVLAGLGAVSVAIGTTMVGAVRALTVAMMANPLGLLIAGIAAAVAAIFIFRDEIKQAIGIDVVDAVKSAANFIIGSFVGAFNGIKETFAQLPAALGDLMVQAANSVLRAIRWMLRGVQVEFNKFFGALDQSLQEAGLPLTNIRVDPIKINAPGLENPWEGAAERVADAFGKAIGDAKDIDYVEQLRTAIGELWDTSDGAVDSINALGEAFTGGGSDGGGKGGGLTDSLAQALEAMRLALATEEEAERLSHEKRLAQIQEFYDKGLIAKAEYDDLMERAHEAHAERMNEITRKQVEEESRIRSQLIGHASSIFGSLSTIMQNFGEENLAASKAFAVAAAIINTAEGITKALAQGGILGFAGAAAVAASGAAQISTILSAQKGGSGRPTVGASSGALREIPQQPTQQAVSIKLEGDYHPTSNVEQMIDELLKMQRDGYQIILDRG